MPLVKAYFTVRSAGAQSITVSQATLAGPNGLTLVLEVRLAQVYETQLGNHNEAIAAYKEAVRIDPKSGIACFYAGEICRAFGFREAISSSTS